MRNQFSRARHDIFETLNLNSKWCWNRICHLTSIFTGYGPLLLAFWQQSKDRFRELGLRCLLARAVKWCRVSATYVTVFWEESAALMSNDGQVMAGAAPLMCQRLRHMREASNMTPSCPAIVRIAWDFIKYCGSLITPMLYFVFPLHLHTKMKQKIVNSIRIN